MDLHRLAVFAKVYELRSLSRSAEAVFLSQPTISGHLKKLEEEVGARLFDRLGRGVAPTKAAEVLYGYARRLLALRDEAVEAVAAMENKVRGRLMVGASTIPGNYLLPGFLSQMRTLYPELKVCLRLSDTAGVADLVEAGEVELGLTGARLENRRLNQSPCWKDEMVLAVSRDHPWADLGSIDPDRVRESPFVLREPGSGTRMSTARALAGLGLKLSDLSVAAELGSTEAVRQGVLANLGASILSRVAVEDDFAAGRLVEVEVKGLSLSREFFLITRSGRTLSPGGRRLVRLIKCEDGYDQE
jgi:DNA-binding transcriptional LysR family regulator